MAAAAGIITTYLNALSNGSNDGQFVIVVRNGLNCIQLAPGVSVPGFRRSGGTNVRYDLRGYDDTRPKAYRVPYLGTPELRRPGLYRFTPVPQSGLP